MQLFYTLNKKLRESDSLNCKIIIEYEILSYKQTSSRINIPIITLFPALKRLLLKLYYIFPITNYFYRLWGCFYTTSLMGTLAVGK